MSRQARPNQTFLIAAGVGAAYFALALAAITFTRLSDNVALLWLANAPLLAALCTRPARERLGLLIATGIASLAATMVSSPYSPLVIFFVLANLGEALIGWALLRSMGHARDVFLRMRSIPAFIIAAGLVAPALSGCVAALTLWFARDADPVFTWTNWMIGHGLGILIGTPVALLVLGGRAYREGLTRPGTALAFAMVMLSTVLVTAATFYQSRLPLLFLPILPAVFATVTFRFAGAALSVFAIAGIGALATMTSHGPVELVRGSEAVHLQFFQFYIGVVFLVTLPFATLMAANQRLADSVAASEARYRIIADNASDVILSLDPDGTIRYASPAVRELGGFDPASMVGRNASEMVAEEDRDKVRALHAAAFAAPDRSHRVDYRGLLATGASRWFEITTRAVAGENGRITAMICIVRDLNQRKAREDDLERQATTDPMTGVLNRRAFQKRLAELPPREFGSTGVLALLDLDHFKSVNDSWGHAAGDAALLVFADVMRANLRGEDAIGRLGGEEFAILFPGLHPAAALAACERVRQSLAETAIITDPGCFRVTVSIGIAAICPGTSPEAVFRQADAALYRAKSLGRNRSELAEG